MSATGFAVASVRSVPEQARERIAALVAAVETAVAGRRREIELTVTGLLAGGHVLVEGPPGTGKTTLARSVAQALGLTFRRIQFTADLLPSDVTGVSVPDPASGALVFRPGPLFAHVVLADELNRAPPRTQSALLECMSEGRVTVDGRTHDLPRPFVVLATQGAAADGGAGGATGAHALPESQLDRFLLRVAMPPPSREDERRILRARRSAADDAPLVPVLGAEGLRELIALAAEVRVHPEVEDYALDLLDATRAGGPFLAGLSPRAGACLVRAAKAHALLDGRDYVVPRDVQRLAVPVLAHRAVPSPSGAGGRSREALIAALVERTPVPA